MRVIFFSFLLISFCTTAQPWNFYLFPEEINEKNNCLDSIENGAHACSIHYSYIGELNYVLKLRNTFYSEKSKTNSSLYKDKLNLIGVSAKKYLLNKTKNEQLVMINEAHYAPFHRVFTMDLLAELYKQGFRYIGLEGLVNHNETLHEINTTRYPTINSGYYIREPQYGNLIRYAIQLGFTVFAYDENNTKSVNEREIDQANNILKIIKKDSTAKILIHAGWGHIREDTTEIKTMAYYIKKFSGIDPFTISQASYNQQSDQNYESEMYIHFSPKNIPSTYLDKKTKKPISISGCDLTIFHPRINYENERPNYLKKNKMYYKIPLTNKFSLKEPHLIFAFIKSELDSKNEPVPVDLIYVQKNYERIQNLFVPFKGEYTIVYKTKSDIKFYSISN